MTEQKNIGSAKDAEKESVVEERGMSALFDVLCIPAKQCEYNNVINAIPDNDSVVSVVSSTMCSIVGLKNDEDKPEVPINDCD